MIEADAIVAHSCDATGLDDFGGDTWREGFGRLVEALNTEARLNELGTQIVAGELLNYLSDRLRVVASPDPDDVDVTPPIVIVGQARTGTTMLFDLMAQDPAHRVPLAWEVDRPCPPPETATYETDARIDEVQQQLESVEYLIPGFLKIHQMGARLGQECVRIYGHEFRSLIFPTQFHVPSYGRWLVYEADMAPAYQWHRRFLCHLGSRHRGQRWLLKSPAHIWHLPALQAEYPDALLVHTHRDALRCIASVSSLQHTLHRLYCDEDGIALPEIAAEWADYIVEGLDRSVTAREDGTVGTGCVVDLEFKAVMSDPLGAVRTVYDRFGLELTAKAEQRMATFLATHPAEPGGHTYSWADTGLDLGPWRERARRYTDYFGVAPEPV
jgi:hypothetical protein